MKIYPNNTVAMYTTQLANSVELNGEWEVALTEFMYTNNWCNLKGEWYRIIAGEWSKQFPFPDDYYPSTIAVFQKLKELVNVHYDALTMEIDDNRRIQLKHSRNLLLGFETSPRLTKILGLKGYKIKTKGYTFTGVEMESTFASQIANLYVYCDILEHVPVGDTMAPLLRCVNVKGKYADRICDTFTSPMYLPVQKKVFDSVEINIMTDTGEPVPFTDERSSVTLHFRRSRNPYFLTK
jgi:hypothetical protein